MGFLYNMYCHCFTSTTIAKQKTLGLNYPTKKYVLKLNEENYTVSILDLTTPFQFITVSVMVRRLSCSVLCFFDGDLELPHFRKVCKTNFLKATGSITATNTTLTSNISI